MCPNPDRLTIPGVIMKRSPTHLRIPYPGSVLASSTLFITLLGCSGSSSDDDDASSPLFSTPTPEASPNPTSEPDVSPAPSSEPDVSPTPIGVEDFLLDVSGHTVQHSLTRLAAEQSGQLPQFSDLVVELHDPGSFAESGQSLLLSAPLETDDCGGESPCTWAFSEVQIPDAAPGLVASIRDGRSSAPLWVPTWATIADPDTLVELAVSGEALAGAETFALTYDAIETVIGPLIGLDEASILERGLVVGVVGGQPASDGHVPPVAGCTVLPGTSGQTIYYPNSNVSALTTTTANQGIFFAVPDAAGGVLSTTYAITPPDGQTLTWDSTFPVWIGPDVVTVQLFVAE
jgi:hypothetical protein